MVHSRRASLVTTAVGFYYNVDLFSFETRFGQGSPPVTGKGDKTEQRA